MRRLNILFVDSDLHAYARMHQALHRDFAMRWVASVAEARHFLETSLPDVVICEVVLNGAENGLELCRYIRNKPALKRLPIILLTSLATLQDKVAGFEAGTDDYVVKPFDTRHLIARIRLIARIKRLEQR